MLSLVGRARGIKLNLAPLSTTVMPDIAAPSKRLREWRERAGLSHNEAARRMGVSSPCIWDIESFEDELASCHSP